MEVNKYSGSFYISSVPRINAFHMARWLSVVVLLISVLTIFPHESLSQDESLSTPQFCEVTGDIHFTVVKWDPLSSVCVLCTGPWGRTSSKVVFSYDGPERPVIPCTFYAVNRTVFSPFGKWECKLFSYIDDPQSPFCGNRVNAEATFCLENIQMDPDKPVHMTVGGSVIEIDGRPPPPCKSSAVSFLGDHPAQKSSIRDKDEYLFNSVAGEEIILRLETETQEGHNGGEAILGIEGGSFKELTSGTLPLELSVVLPEDGQYTVLVTQPGRPDDQSFRGSYVLTISPLNESIDLIEPAKNVER